MPRKGQRRHGREVGGKQGSMVFWKREKGEGFKKKGMIKPYR